MNWNMILVHVIFHVLYFKRGQQCWKQISASLGIYTILCWSSDVPPPLVLQKFKFLASSIVQVSVSSSTRCDAVSVCLSWTHTLLKCKLATLAVLMPLNSGMPEVIQELCGLLKTWSVRLHRRNMWNVSLHCVLSRVRFAAGVAGVRPCLENSRPSLENAYKN